MQAALEYDTGEHFPKRLWRYPSVSRKSNTQSLQKQPACSRSFAQFQAQCRGCWNHAPRCSCSLGASTGQWRASETNGGTGSNQDTVVAAAAAAAAHLVEHRVIGVRTS